MKIGKWIYILGATAIFSTTVMAQNTLPVLKADIYEQNSKREKKIYTLEITREEKDGLTTSKAIYKDLQGKTVVEEVGVLKGSELVSFNVEQLQTKESGAIKVQDGKFLFTYKDTDGKESTTDEKAKGKLLVAANFNSFIKDNITKLSAGEELDIRFGVWFRQETVGFTFKKMKEGEINGKKAIQFRMKPTSFVIAQIVDPLYFWYTVDGSELLELNGRVPPKTAKGDSWKDLDAEVVYQVK
ncbi:MAG: hypothetical protein ACOYOK_04760 [Pseudobdellovibrionaceae bacterium]